jgi:hypothetical protein
MEAEREGFVEPHAIGVSWRTRVSSGARKRSRLRKDSGADNYPLQGSPGRTLSALPDDRSQLLRKHLGEVESGTTEEGRIVSAIAQGPGGVLGPIRQPEHR